MVERLQGSYYNKEQNGLLSNRLSQQVSHGGGSEVDDSEVESNDAFGCCHRADRGRIHDTLSSMRSGSCDSVTDRELPSKKLTPRAKLTGGSRSSDSSDAACDYSRAQTVQRVDGMQSQCENVELANSTAEETPFDSLQSLTYDYQKACFTIKHAFSFADLESPCTDFG